MAIKAVWVRTWASEWNGNNSFLETSGQLEPLVRQDFLTVWDVGSREVRVNLDLHSLENSIKKKYVDYTYT